MPMSSPRMSTMFGFTPATMAELGPNEIAKRRINIRMAEFILVLKRSYHPS